MNASLLAIRAIATELAYRVFKPLVIIVAIASVILIALMVWLITMSAWWLLLAVPVFIGIAVVSLLLLFSGIIIRIVSPRPTSEQKKKVAAFVDKIQRLSEVTQTPKVFLLFRAIQDVMVPSRNGFVQSMITDTTSLGGDFKDLLATFSRH